VVWQRSGAPNGVTPEPNRTSVTHFWCRRLTPC